MTKCGIERVRRRRKGQSGISEMEMKNGNQGKWLIRQEEKKWIRIGREKM